MFFMRKNIVSIGLIFLINISCHSSELKLLNVYKANYTKLDSLSNEELRALSFEQFRSGLGFEGDFTVIKKKDIVNFQDAAQFNRHELVWLYKKYCNVQNGTLEQWDSRFGGKGEFGDEFVCIVNKTPAFYGRFALFYENCSYVCDDSANKRSFERAEFTLSQNAEKLIAYKSNYTDYLHAEEEIQKKANEEVHKKQLRQDEENRVKSENVLQQKFLKDRKGQYVYTFYDQFIYTPGTSGWRYSNTKEQCANHCDSLNTPFSTLQDALTYGWGFLSLIDNNVHESGISNCECVGKTYILKH